MKSIWPSLIFSFILLSLEWQRRVVEGSYSAMGFRSYTSSHFQMVLELYKMYDRSFHLIHASLQEIDTRPPHTDVAAPVWAYVKQTEATDDEKAMERPDDEINIAMEKELFHMKRRAATADALAELTTILAVQYLSLVYAIQFGRGFTHFENAKNSEKSMACLKLAYYLAWFGLESDFIFARLDAILQLKYSKDRASYLATKRNLSQTRDNLKRVQTRFATPETTVFDPEAFFDRAFQTRTKVIGLYFREALLGKTIVAYEQVFDWTETHPELWSRASEFLRRMRDPHEAKYLNHDSGQENAYKSNIVSILRSVELFNVEKHFGNDFVKTIQKGLVGKFLIVKPTGRDGKLKFYEQRVGVHFVTSTSESMETKETSVRSAEEGLTLLGIRNFEVEHMRIFMEIMKICTKGEDYALKNSVWMQEKYSSYWNTYFETSEFGRSNLPRIRTESKNVYWQSYVATYLTDLYSIFFVQYLASIHSIRFAYGFVHFKNEKKVDEAARCAKVAYFLARYGIDSELVLLATEKILRGKYPEELTGIRDIKGPTRRISRLIYENVVRKYDLSREKINFEAKYFESQVRSSETEENIVDINSSKILWNEIDVFDDMIDVIHTQSYVNLYPGIADTFANTAVSIVQFAEILSASGTIQKGIPDLVIGLTNENFLVRRYFDGTLKFAKSEKDPIRQ